MRELDEREKELLRKLREAGKPQNHFTLSLKINDIIIEERVFPADKYSLETLTETRTHFLMNDLSACVLSCLRNSITAFLSLFYYAHLAMEQFQNRTRKLFWLKDVFRLNVEIQHTKYYFLFLLLKFEVIIQLFVLGFH